MGRKRWFSGVVWVGLLACWAFPTRAAVILLADLADNEVNAAGTITNPTTTVTVRVGESTTFGFGRAGVFPFQLPNLGPVANPFDSASFTFKIASSAGALPGTVVINMDGLPARSSPTVLGADYAAAASIAGSHIQDTILSVIATGTKSTSAAGNANLLNYLNEQYASGAGAGNYVFVRLKPTGAVSGAAGYNVSAADAGGSVVPQIAYTTPAPEPGTLGVLTLAVVAWSARRRRI